MFDISLRIKSIILAISLFFVGLIYGDAPVKIDYAVDLNGTEISTVDSIEVSVGGQFSVNCSCKNVGRPFEGKDIYYPIIYFYKIENGEKKQLAVSSIILTAESKPILIAKEENFSCKSVFLIDNDAEPGVYTMVVSVYGCEQIYEDVLTVK